MEKEKLTPLVLTLGLIIYGCTASAGQNDKIDSDRTFTVHLYSPIIGDEDRGSIYGSGYSGPYLAPGGDTEVPPDPTPSYPSINQVDDQTNALMLSSIASAAVMYAADELLIDSSAGCSSDRTLCGGTDREIRFGCCWRIRHHSDYWPFRLCFQRTEF